MNNKPTKTQRVIGWIPGEKHQQLLARLRGEIWH